MKAPIITFSLFLLTLLTAVPADALTARQAAERMRDRVQAIDQLKASGKAGENNRGYLEARSELEPAAARLVAEENADRKVVYAAVADRTGQSIEAVGKQRALKILQISKPGVWVQKPNGDWTKK